MTFLQLDPLGYMLFGAFNLRVTDNGLECDNWLPIVGNVSALDDVERLKDVLDCSLLRVFEGLGVAISRGRERQAVLPAARRHDDEEGEGEGDEEAMNLDDPTLSPAEVVDLDRLTSGVVKVLNMCVSRFPFSFICLFADLFLMRRFAESRGDASRGPSRPETPAGGNYPGGGGGGNRLQSLAQASGRGFTASLPVTRTVSPRDSPFNSRPGSSAGVNFGGSGGGGGGGGGWGAASGGGAGGGGDWRSRG